MKVFAVLGTTDEVTECEHCGRVDLKYTIMLDALDADGNRTGDVSYFGATCGARAAGWTTAREFQRAAKDADKARREADWTEKMAQNDAWTARRDAWIDVNVGPDAREYPHRYGFSSVRLVSHFIEMTGDTAP